MADTVQQIKDRLSIQEVVSQYVTLTRAGSTYKARCPFHAERTPSFVVSPARGTYHCFGCGVGGDIFTFVQEIEGLDFKGALKMLAERAGVEITYERPETRDAREQQFATLADAAQFFATQLTETHPARSYLHDRGVTDETISAFQLGWAPDDWHMLTNHLRSSGHHESTIEATGLAKRSDKGGSSNRLYDRFRSRIMFPMSDSAGRVVAFSGRIFGPPADDPAAAKYINSPETDLFHKSRILYGYDRAKQVIRKYNFSILVEGQMDLVMSHQAGWANAVAVSGTALTREHVTLLERMSSNLVLALDADSAGVRAAEKSAKVALAAGMDVKVAVLQKGVDPADLIASEGPDAWKKTIRESVHIIPYLLQVLESSARDTRAFRLAAERVVVPFLAAMKSPIEREHFTHEVASKLGMSEETVREALSAAPRDEQSTDASNQSRPNSRESNTSQNRLRQLFGLLLWQEASPDPQVDAGALATDIDTAGGEGTVERLRASSPDEKESLRFTAERLYGESNHLMDDARALLSVLLHERLQKELAQATVSLRTAEGKGDEVASTAALEQCRILTGRIADLDKTVYSIDEKAAKAA